MMDPKNDLAIFGGAFDPPHLGHEQALVEVIQKLDLKHVWILPAWNPPLKTATTSYDQRLAFCQQMTVRIQNQVKGFCEVAVSTFERDHQLFYTADVLEKLNQQGKKVIFIMGADQVLQWKRWHRFPEVVGLANWVIWQRNGMNPTAIDLTFQAATGEGWLIQKTDSVFETLGGAALNGPRSVMRIPISAVATSSTEIRAAFARGNQDYIKSVLHPDTLNTIERNQLYGT